MNTLHNVNVTRVLNRHFEENEAKEPALQRLAGSEAMPSLTDKSVYRDVYQFLKDFPLSVSRETGALLYILARSHNVRTIVEFGTSLGVSTIHLAAALRDNGGGRLITKESERNKAEKARANLREAGLDELVEIRVGDALVTLSENSPSAVDLLLLDGAKALYLDVLRKVEASLHSGSLVLADDAELSPSFVQHMREGGERYLSIPFASGDVEVSMQL